MNDPLLCTLRLTKRYGSVTVLDHVDFDLQAGEIHGLLGANGAGKSTLCQIIAGLILPSTGRMTIRGTEFRPANKKAAERKGVDIVQQELNLIPTLSVAENLLLTRLPAMAGVIRQNELHRQARCILDRFGLSDVDAAAPVADLGVGRQQMVEIAAALARDCRILILDEPTSALSSAEAERLFGWLDSLRRQGVGLIYISHRLDEVARATDRVTVLRDGKVVCTRATRELDTDEMVALMSGEARDVRSATEFQTFARPEVALRAEQISRGRLRDVSFTVHRGERLGIAGLVGSGRTELLRVIFGADVATSGHVILGETGTPQRFRSPRQAVAAGLAMVTEDRKQNGLLLPQSIRVNATLSALTKDFSSWGVIRWKSEQQAAAGQRDLLEIHSTSVEQPVRTLSGGNQQKVAIARWLLRGAEVFLFDEPTRGIDMATRRRIYRLFDSLAEQGKALVIVSSDLDELFEICDRIAVMSAGRLVDTFDRSHWSEDQIMQAAFSEYATRQSATG